jgi:hypothetical protein
MDYFTKHYIVAIKKATKENDTAELDSLISEIYKAGFEDGTNETMENWKPSN